MLLGIFYIIFFYSISRINFTKTLACYVHRGLLPVLLENSVAVRHTESNPHSPQQPVLPQGCLTVWEILNIFLSGLTVFPVWHGY